MKKSRIGWLALLPVTGFLSGGFISQHVPALIGGFPFLMLWNSGWALTTSAVLALIYYFDPENRSNEE